jgi:hypothetical protein
MPRRDGTGPIGLRPMTGRGAGLCYNNAFRMRFQDRAFGGYGCQRGYRRQFIETGIPGYLRSNFSGNIPDMDEKTYLTNQEIVLNNQLKLVKERLADMDDSKE